jgi:hypothetical protein
MQMEHAVCACVCAGEDAAETATMVANNASAMAR